MSDQEYDSPEAREERYLKRQKKKKEIVDARIASATEERGVLLLLRGNGKGKSSSAFGMLARALGHGQRCAVVQFIKGRGSTGEYKFFSELPQVDFHVMGHGFSWETQDLDKDREAARQAWQLTLPMLQNPDYNLIVLDELSYMIKYGHLDAAEVAEALANRHRMVNVVVTGRVMADELLAVADTVSTIKDDGHAFRKGVKSQPGIDW
ncbi:cob(I)yrinic acid a,c-diamide adenosyltransferase [Marinobacterium arenosum]|uniref:cob(I)yrinic acid a,c-diamide adenosyltransferase n=1 Tax=Marinobacterium arenosum TaxID=2862496 RepID=UPI001C968058|nr:cob(I)yrinic acid a,c-diamide adenosyltransferase [Marinobacterium arenosum]MBY4676039.1 cob(I)yrinic acid a,c-diamide adenosyltransferase [Marinobacterium arenosum]